MNGPLDHDLAFSAEDPTAHEYGPGYDALAQAAMAPLIQGPSYEDWLPRRQHRAEAPEFVVAETRAEQTGRAPIADRGRGRRAVMLAGPVVVLGLIVAGVSLWWTTNNATDAPAVPSVSTSAVAADWCPDSSADPPSVRGNGAGSVSSAAEVILALEYAYYVHRDAGKVRELLAPESRFGTEEDIQAGIDATPKGTVHCVEAAPLRQDRWSVLVTERRPSGSTVVHNQIISVLERDGRAYITAVESA
ncbi:hypothetical protein [Nocardia carnea]|uniref:hypothetical protein n=1 Tax=Nocardia carnea TaxID=37328 RepID=UPI0024567AB8|nr:hypothetical protein [Nocardia carnea]